MTSGKKKTKANLDRRMYVLVDKDGYFVQNSQQNLVIYQTKHGLKKYKEDHDVRGMNVMIFSLDEIVGFEEALGKGEDD